MSTPSLERVGQQRVEEWLQNGDRGKLMSADVIGDSRESKHKLQKTPRDDMEIGTRFGLGTQTNSMLRARKLFMEAERLREEKRKMVTEEVSDTWRATIKLEIEENITRQVREALSTPPLERMKRNKERSKQRYLQRMRHLNSHLTLDLTERERDYLRYKRVQHAVEEVKARARAFSEDNINTGPLAEADIQERYDRLFQSAIATQDVSQQLVEEFDPMETFGTLSRREKNELYFMFTKRGFLGALRRGTFHNGSELEALENGRYRDRYGITRDQHGPFWPPDYGPLFPAPEHQRVRTGLREPLTDSTDVEPLTTHENQTTCYTARWRGVQTVYDSETSARNYAPAPAPENCAPSLTFESRFECGNLRQARRTGQFEYELVLQTDLYTKRHTQWFYFRLGNMVAGLTYKIIITNLLKPTSLYNNGMRPLFYSQYSVDNGGCGWTRKGHHVSYSRNSQNLHSPLLARDRSFYMLQFQVEFEHDNDDCYLAHCYPYTYTDLRNDLDWLTSSEDTRKVVRQDVLCETKVGNSCFVLTVTNFEEESSNRLLREKKCVVVSGRVHPGESNASWMMRGLINFITSGDPQAKQLRDDYVFKIVPMLNPDGVIVGNYRCSLGARDLNRNYRHPRKENFPTIWHVKKLAEEMAHKHQVVVYCDFHGHSRKSNVFMYGCDPTETQPATAPHDIQSFINGRLFPWLMAQGAPDKFSFSSCKFRVRRCKESTGRVVMWRQLNIENSYTIEASFSGTTLDKECLRHFNTEDLECIGRVFCQTVLEHQKIRKDAELHASVVVSITKSLILQLADSCQETSLQSEHFLQRVEDQLRSEDESKSAEVSSMLVKLLARDKPAIERQKTRILTSPEMTSSNDAVSGSEEKMEMTSLQTIENCFRLLEDLHLTENVLETDSSDSDSESEPEMRKQEPSKKKKKKSKKKRDQDKISRQTQKRNSLGSEPMVLPAIVPQEITDDKLPEQPPDTLPEYDTPISSLFTTPAPFARTPLSRRVTPGSECVMNSYASGWLYDMNVWQKSSNRQRSSHTKSSTGPLFISKFEGRHNNGIPCFSEERSLERAAKKYEEKEKRREEQRQKDAMLYFPPPRSVTIATINRCSVAMGDQRPHNSRNEGVLQGSTNRNQGFNLYSVQLANEEAADRQDGDGDMNSRQVALSSSNHNMSANVTRALLRWRSRCMSGSGQDYPIPLSGFHLSPMDYAIPEEEMSHSDSPLSDSEEEADYYAMLPRRRQSLPNTSTYRITSHQNAYISSQKLEPKRSEPKLLSPVMNNKSARRHSNGLVKGSAVAPSGGAVGQETMIKDMIVAPSTNHNTQAHLQAPPLVDGRADVLAVLQSVTSNANKQSDVNRPENAEFFKVNSRCGQGKNHEGGVNVPVPDSDKYRKTSRRSVQKSVTDVEPSERPMKMDGEIVYSTNLLKPCPPLNHPQYLPIPPLPLIPDTAVDNKTTLTKLLRSRAHNNGTRHQADKPT